MCSSDLERDAAVQFMQGLGAFISQVAPMAQQVPGAAPYLLKLLQWSVSKFRVSQDIEGVLDQAIGALQQQSLQPPGPSPMQQAEVAEKMAGAEERKAKAAGTSLDNQAKAMQLAAIRGPMMPPQAPAPMGPPPNPVMQPNPQLPPMMQ